MLYIEVTVLHLKGVWWQLNELVAPPTQKSNQSNKIVANYIPFVIGRWIYLDKTRIKKNRFI